MYFFGTLFGYGLITVWNRSQNYIG